MLLQFSFTIIRKDLNSFFIALLFYCVTLLLRYSFIALLFYCVTLLLCYSFIVLLFYCFFIFFCQEKKTNIKRIFYIIKINLYLSLTYNFLSYDDRLTFCFSFNMPNTWHMFFIILYYYWMHEYYSNYICYAHFRQ